jgi:hypothetical protein
VARGEETETVEGVAHRFPGVAEADHGQRGVGDLGQQPGQRRVERVEQPSRGRGRRGDHQRVGPLQLAAAAEDPIAALGVGLDLRDGGREAEIVAELGGQAIGQPLQAAG